MNKSILFLFLSLISCSFSSSDASEPTGHGYSVTSITATQKGGEAGNRRSDSCLKIVIPEYGVPAADLIASGSGTKPNDQPRWSGTGVNGADGSLSATWSGRSSSTATCTAPDGQASVELSTHPRSPKEVKLSKESLGIQKFEEKITDWLTRYGSRPTWTIEGEVSVKSEACDYHEDGERLGVQVGAGGSVSVKAPKVGGESLKIPIGWGVSVYGILEFNPFTVKADVRFNYDEKQADPWKDPVDGSIEVTAGGKVGLGAQWGPDVVNVNAEGTANIDLNGSGKFDNEGRNIRLAEARVTFAKIKLQGTAEIKLGPLEIKFWEGECPVWDGATYNVPGLPLVIYSIPANQ